MDTARVALGRDWDWGEYVDCSVIEGHVPYDEIEDLEKQSMDIIEKAAEKFPMFTSWSTGIDSLVVLHLLYRLDRTDVPLLHSANPMYYPSNLEYAEELPARLGFTDCTFKYNEAYDWEWLMSDPESHVFPSPGDYIDQIKANFRSHAIEYFAERDVTLNLVGSRGEDNIAPTYLYERDYMTGDQRQFNAIRDWETIHVIGYLDKYDIPIDTAYKAHPGGWGMWNREKLYNWAGKQKQTEANMWYKVRKTTVELGHTSFWDTEILPRFPRAEKMAREYAEQMDVSFPSVERGYELGADAGPVVPDAFAP